MYLSAALLLLFHVFAPVVTDCGAMSPPVESALVRPFAPIGRYRGHWGIDFGVTPGTEVAASDDGMVSFAGVVAGNRTITVDHGGGVRSSYSYLTSLTVGVGDMVGRGGVIGRSGIAHGTDALHFSVRIAGTYVDPASFLGCSMLSPASGLRLVPTSRSTERSAYAVDREKRDTRRHFRSAPYCTSDRRRGRL